LCFAIVGSGAVVAFASTAHVGGGTWDYGVGGGWVWSNYYHSTKVHRSSVQGAQYVDSGWKSPKVTSYAKAPSRWYWVDHAYWDTKD